MVLAHKNESKPDLMSENQNINSRAIELEEKITIYTYRKPQ